jgi:Arc/MetJ family transcription regulator
MRIHIGNGTIMRTNIELDDKLVEEAFKVSGAKTKRELVHIALQALIRAGRKKDLLDLAGKVEFYEGYDHKKLRRTRYDAD